MGESSRDMDVQEEVLDSVLQFNPLDELNNALSGSNGDVFATPETKQTENTSSISTNTGTVMNETVLDANADGVDESLFKIFSAVIVGGITERTPEADQLRVKKAKEFKQTLNMFLSEFRDNIFENEYAVLYSAISTLSVKVFTVNQLDTVLDYSADEILGSNRIHLEKYSLTATGSVATDDEKLMAFKLDVNDLFNKLSHYYVSTQEFETACTIYKMYFKEKYMTELTQTMAMIMTDGVHEKTGKGRSRFWKGTDDCMEYYSIKIAMLNSISNVAGDNSDYIVDEDWFSEEVQAEKNGESPILMDTSIKEIDDAYGGLRRGNIFEVMGPPKGGKTTFCQFLANEAMERGLNVAVWALEGTKEEWIAAFVSLIVRKKDGINIDKTRVLMRKYRDERERQAVIAAKNMLALDPKRGKLSFIGKACYIERMVEDMNFHWKNINPFDVIVMDSPILAQSLRGKSRTDTAAEAYTTLKHYISYELYTKALGLVTCQLKQTVIDEIRNNPDAEVDVTAGGVTAETIRTPDFVTCLLSTREERKMGQVKIRDVAARHSSGFDPFYMGAELGSAYFYSDPALNEV